MWTKSTFVASSFLSVVVSSHPPPGVDIEQGIGIIYLCFVLILLYYDYEIMKTISYSLHNFLFLSWCGWSTWSRQDIGRPLLCLLSGKGLLTHHCPPRGSALGVLCSFCVVASSWTLPVFSGCTQVVFVCFVFVSLFSLSYSPTASQEAVL